RTALIVGSCTSAGANVLICSKSVNKLNAPNGPTTATLKFDSVVRNAKFAATPKVDPYETIPAALFENSGAKYAIAFNRDGDAFLLYSGVTKINPSNESTFSDQAIASGVSYCLFA